MKNAQDRRQRVPSGRGLHVRCHTAAGVSSRRDILETRLVRKGTIMGDKCPTRGELSRHDERLRLIGGRIRACSCAYIGGKYRDDAWVYYLLGYKAAANHWNHALRSAGHFRPRFVGPIDLFLTFCFPDVPSAILRIPGLLPVHALCGGKQIPASYHPLHPRHYAFHAASETWYVMIR